MENMKYILTVATPMNCVDGMVKMIKQDMDMVNSPTIKLVLQHALTKICEKSILYVTVLNGTITSCLFVFNRPEAVEWSVYFMDFFNTHLMRFIHGRNVTDAMRKGVSNWKQRLRHRQLCSWIGLLQVFQSRDICRKVFRCLYGKTPDANPSPHRHMFGYKDNDGAQLYATIDGPPDAERFWSAWIASQMKRTQ
jgi:hypothetical protein